MDDSRLEALLLQTSGRPVDCGPMAPFIDHHVQHRPQGQALLGSCVPLDVIHGHWRAAGLDALACPPLFKLMSWTCHHAPIADHHVVGCTVCMNGLVALLDDVVSVLPRGRDDYDNSRRQLDTGLADFVAVMFAAACVGETRTSMAAYAFRAAMAYVTTDNPFLRATVTLVSLACGVPGAITADAVLALVHYSCQFRLGSLPFAVLLAPVKTWLSSGAWGPADSARHCMSVDSWLGPWWSRREDLDLVEDSFLQPLNAVQALQAVQALEGRAGHVAELQPILDVVGLSLATLLRGFTALSLLGLAWAAGVYRGGCVRHGMGTAFSGGGQKRKKRNKRRPRPA
jgi:hypothetical protein